MHALCDTWTIFQVRHSRVGAILGWVIVKPSLICRGNYYDFHISWTLVVEKMSSLFFKCDHAWSNKIFHVKILRAIRCTQCVENSNYSSCIVDTTVDNVAKTKQPTWTIYFKYLSLITRGPLTTIGLNRTIKSLATFLKSLKRCSKFSSWKITNFFFLRNLQLRHNIDSKVTLTAIARKLLRESTNGRSWMRTSGSFHKTSRSTMKKKS